MSAARLAWKAFKCEFSHFRGAPASAPEPRRILVLGHAALGDLLFLWPALEALRARFPAARIVIVSSPYPPTQELLSASGLADEIWLHDAQGSALALRDLNRRIAAYGFDWALLSLAAPAYDFEESLRAIPVRAGHVQSLLPEAGGHAPLARAWMRFKRGLVSGEFVRRSLLNKPVRLPEAAEHAVRRNFRLLDALGVPHAENPRPALPLTPESREEAGAALSGLPRPLVGVHLGSVKTQHGRLWPAERLARLCALLRRKCRASFVAVGGGDESSRAKLALAVFPELVDLTGRTSLLGSLAAITRCELFLSCDTGLAKAAMALGVPTVTLWGPTGPGEHGAIWDPERHLDLRTGIVCSPCVYEGMAVWRKGLPNYLNCGHFNCLALMDEGWVAERILEKHPWLAEKGGRPLWT